MRPRRNRLLLMPAGAGVVLGAALLWSWWVVRPVALHGTERLAANVPAATADRLDLDRPGAAEIRRGDPWHKRPTWTWAAAGPEHAGLFDQRGADRGLGPEVPRIRRREVELVATRDLPFRLQLIGHFGEGGNLSGIFEAEGASGAVIARSGDELPELGLTVRTLESGSGGAAGNNAPGLVARIWDRRTDREVVLAESVRVPSGIGAALLAPAGYPGEAIELLAGDVVEVGDSEFLVERIGLAPASARLRRLAVAVPSEGDDELFLQVEEDPES